MKYKIDDIIVKRDGNIAKIVEVRGGAGKNYLISCQGESWVLGEKFIKNLAVRPKDDNSNVSRFELMDLD